MRTDLSMTDSKSHACSKHGSGYRNRYFRGKAMRVEEFQAEQDYAIARRRLLNRTVTGWGVVRGLRIHAPHSPSSGAEQIAPQPISVGPGLALDAWGREIALLKPQALDANDTFRLTIDPAGLHVSTMEGNESGSYVLSAHYAERAFGDVNLPGECDCARIEQDFVCETVVFSLTPLDTKKCPCGEPPCGRRCRCGAKDACGEGGRGPHACLCRWMGEFDPEETPALCEWNGYRIDPRAGVQLACLRLGASNDPCGPIVKGWIEDDCGPRRLVKNNDLLYDLLRGCDLTHIEWISWHDWHRCRSTPVEWPDFRKKFQSKEGFTVRFSRPVCTETLQPDAVSMTASTLDQGTGWLVQRRVPISSIDTTADGNLPPKTTNKMRIQFDPGWLDDELRRGRYSWLSETPFEVMIEIRGDYILDCHGQAVDANAIGIKGIPSGNNTPGDSFVSIFLVAPKPPTPPGAGGTSDANPSEIERTR